MTTSSLELKFDFLWNQLYPNIDLETEVKLIPKRRFRFDYVHHPSKTAIEVNGGNYIRGRHTRASGLENEYEKIRLAAKLGYQTIIISGSQINEEVFNDIIEIIKLRTNYEFK